MEAAVLRLLEFRPRRPAFDTILRDEVVPAMLAMPGIVDVFAGRSGPDELGRRLVASVWESERAMQASLGDGGPGEALGQTYLGATMDRDAAHLPLRLCFPVSQPVRGGILRLFRGRVRAGELDDYVREALGGTEADRAARHGPVGLFLGTPGPGSFVTLSIWADWDDLLAATGGNHERPIATRHAERLVAWEVSHYEVLPDLARPPLAPAADAVPS